MKKLVLFLLLAWFAIYAGNHVLFVSTPMDIDTVLASQKSDLDTQARKIDSWGTYLPGVGMNDQKTNAGSGNALPQNKSKDADGE